MAQQRTVAEQARTALSAIQPGQPSVGIPGGPVGNCPAGPLPALERVRIVTGI